MLFKLWLASRVMYENGYIFVVYVLINFMCITQVHEAGGELTLNDMANYEVILREVVQTTYHGKTFCCVSALKKRTEKAMISL